MACDHGEGTEGVARASSAAVRVARRSGALEQVSAPANLLTERGWQRRAAGRGRG
jgi:hypothetical protein